MPSDYSEISYESSQESNEESSDVSVLRDALKIQLACAQDGFDWDDIAPVFDKVLEEISEVKDELAHSQVDIVKVKEEVGDLFFAVVNLSRHLNVDPEHALHTANEKFTSRYKKVETMAQLRGQTLKEMSMHDKEALWQQAKLSK